MFSVNKSTEISWFWPHCYFTLLKYSLFCFPYSFQFVSKWDFTEDPSLCVYSHNISGFPRPWRYKVRMVSEIWTRTINKKDKHLHSTSLYITYKVNKVSCSINVRGMNGYLHLYIKKQVPSKLIMKLMWTEKDLGNLTGDQNSHWPE